MNNYKVLCEFSNKLQQECDQNISMENREIVAAMKLLPDGVTSSWEDIIMRYFKLPKASAYPLDLSGNHVYPYNDFDKNKLGRIEKFLMEREATGSTESSTNAEGMCRVYTHHDVLYLLLCAPYRIKRIPEDNFKILATKYNGDLYLIFWPFLEEIRSEGYDRSTPHTSIKHHCFSDSPNTEPNAKHLVAEHEKIYLIRRTKMKSFDITFSMKIYGVKSDSEITDFSNLEALNKYHFVRTTSMWKRECHWRQHPKIIGWWAQGYLTDVDDIYFAFKDPDGYVREQIKHTRASNLPLNQNWKPEVCITFLHNFMAMVKENMAAVNCPYTVYEYVFDAGEKCVKYKSHEGKTELSFLSEQFVEHIRKA